jgi:hypothetical protein
MNSVHYITYATHEQGMFRELVENPQGVEIKVLGWGEKWNGFGDKITGMIEHIKTLPSHDYVVFLDGFDTEIMKPPQDIMERFNSYGPPGILVSQCPNNYLMRRMFGTCNDKFIANSGMWMGRVDNAIKFLDACKLVLLKNNNDDQRAMNTVCRKHPEMEVVVDHKKLIFHNPVAEQCKDDTIFCSHPGFGGGGVNGFIKRQSRSFTEYAPFLKREIFCLCVALLAMAVVHLYRRKVIR